MAAPKLERTATPGVYKRGGRYVVVFRDPTGRQRRRHARTLSEARDLKATLRADVTRGEYRALSKVTFADYASDWIDTYQGRTSRGFGDGSRSDYRGALEREAVPFFGRMRLASIEQRDVKRFAVKLSARGLAPGSVRKSVAPVRALFATALEEGLIRSNPAAGLRIAGAASDADTQAEEKVKALGDEDLGRLLDELPEGSRLFFEFLAQTGLRIGEAIELRHGDVEGSWLHVQRRYYRGSVGLPKGRKKRRVPLSRDMAQRLWTLRKERHAHGDELLFTTAGGQRLCPSNLLSRVVKPAAVRAGLGVWKRSPAGHKIAETWVGLHSFRHTAATRLFRQGWNAVQVQAFLGHADPGFTLRTYVHLLPEDLPEPLFAQRVDNAWTTQATETGRNDEDAETSDSALTGENVSVAFGTAGA